MKKFILLFILPIFLFSCFGGEKDNNSSEIGIVKNLSDYKQVWKNSFNYYQTNTKEIKKSGVFDFEFTIMLDGNQKDLINKFSSLDLGTSFNSLSIKFDGDYNFLDIKNPKFNGNLKIYLNKRNFGLGDLDLSFTLENKTTLKYYLNNLDKDLLKLFLKDKNQVDTLSLYFEDNKSKELIYNLPESVVTSLFDEVKNVSLEDNLYKNSKEEEVKIISSFLDNEVIEILSGETVGDIDKLNFKFNSDNFVNFLNDVAKILGNQNENKNFNSDKELFKNILVDGVLEIKNNEISNSYINSQIILSGENNSSQVKIEDKLNLKTTLKLVDYKNLNIDFTTLVSSDSTPDNKIQIRLKGLIK